MSSIGSEKMHGPSPLRLAKETTTANIKVISEGIMPAANADTIRRDREKPKIRRNGTILRMAKVNSILSLPLHTPPW